MLAVTILTRDGADSCKGRVETPIGNGPAESRPGFGSNGLGGDSGENYTYKVQLGAACGLNSAAFAVSLIAAFLFLAAAGMQVMLRKHHQKEKASGVKSAKTAKTSSSGGWKSKLPFGRKKNDGLVHDVKDPNGSRDY